MSESAIKFLTLREAADMLRVSIKTVQRWRLLRKIRVHKAGRRVLVNPEQLLQDLEIQIPLPEREQTHGERHA